MEFTWALDPVARLVRHLRTFVFLDDYTQLEFPKTTVLSSYRPS